MPTGEYLQWRAGFTEVAWVVQELLTRCQNWEGPGPGEWNLRELVAHTIRSAALPARLLAAPEPATSDHETAVSYFLAYLAGGQPTRDTVAERGRDEARTMTLEPPDAFEVALRESLLAIRAASAGRILATPWGGIGLDEYLSSRIFELTIHGFDIAAAHGSSVRSSRGSPRNNPKPPDVGRSGNGPGVEGDRCARRARLGTVGCDLRLAPHSEGSKRS